MSDPGQDSSGMWVVLALVVAFAAIGVAYLTFPSGAPTRDARDPGAVPPRDAAAPPLPSESVRETAGRSAPAAPIDAGARPGPPPRSSGGRPVPGSPAEAGAYGPLRTGRSLSPDRSGGSPAVAVEPRTRSPRPSSRAGLDGVGGAPPQEGPQVGAATAREAQTFGASAPASGAVDTETTGSETSSPAVERPNAPRSSSSQASPRGPTDELEEPSSVAVVAMVPSASQVAVGESMSVLIRIDGATNVGHTPFHVVFNPAVLRFVSAVEGSFLAGDGNPTAFFAAPSSDAASVAVGLSRLGRVTGLSGSGDLCLLYFDVVGAGPAGLAFSRAKVRDSSNAIVPAEFLSAGVTAWADPGLAE